jgi:MFS superfamily sulfate permease-like transporter/mannitol/fructose-specific phosphotransferase system IIA component (Ntr-type)
VRHGSRSDDEREQDTVPTDNDGASDDTPGGEDPAGITEDFLASLVVFLVALPLCVGIAVACGVTPERGIITGIIGGIVVGCVAGSPLLVSGPAASLIVPVNDLIQTHGILALGPVVMIAGLWQVLAGWCGLGQWFRAVAPAVITGMLVGIGVLITGSQAHVAIDGEPKSSFLENVTSLVITLGRRLEAGLSLQAMAPLCVGVVTIMLLVAWNRHRPQRWRLVPGHLVSLLAVTLAVAVLGLPVRFLDLSESFFDGLSPVCPPDMAILGSPSILGLSLVFAFVASAATLLTASAIDQRQTHSRTNYDRELIAQGAGNLIAGAVGGLPMTGVIIRSSVNVDAGARTRWSTVMHGIWLLAFVVVAPELLETIPRASLGAILVYTGYNLVDVETLRKLYRRDLPDFAVCVVTLVGVVFVGLFEGIVVGFGGAFIRLSYTLSRFSLTSEAGPGASDHHLHLSGSATFIRLPQLARAIEEIPEGHTLQVHVDKLAYIDQACLELLSQARKARQQGGRPGLVLEWQDLTDRHDPSYMDNHRGAAAQGDIGALLRVLWRDYKRLHHTPHPRSIDSEVSLPMDWVHPSRIVLRLDARSLPEVVTEVARLLSPEAGVPEDVIQRALRTPSEGGYVALGEGVGLPHAALADLRHPLAAIVSTKSPIEVEGESLDLFFGLVASSDDPRTHLHALAQLARVAYDPDALASLRISESPEQALQGFRESVDREPSPRSPRHRSDEVLLVVDLQGNLQAERTLVDLFRQGVLSSPKIASSSIAMAETLGEVLGVPRDHRMLLVSTTSKDASVFRRLVTDSSHLLPGSVISTHLLHAAD